MRPTLFIIPALLIGLSASAWCQAPPAPSSTARIAYDSFTLPNGLEVILVEDHKLPVVAVNIWYHVGPANEGPGLTGFAHLFEHMMFAATKHAPRGLVDRLFEGAGATDSNGSTDFDRTNYYDTLPSNQLELALWAHADRMGYLLDVLDQKALSNQQDVVRNERRQSVENQPYGIVQEALFRQLFPKGHPYHADVMGSHADIQNARLADVRDFFMRYYAPNNASLVIAGDIDKAQARAWVSQYFGSFRRGPEVPKPNAVTPPISGERRLVVADRVELPRVFMGWLTPTAFAPGDAELAIAAHILGGGKASRLYQSLVYEKQLAQDISAVQQSFALSSVFVIDVTARAGHTAQEIDAAIDVELQRMRDQGPTELEVERARNAIETAMLSGVEKLGGDGLADAINRYQQYVGDPAYLNTDLERYRKVSAADVQRVLKAQLRTEARAVVHGIPGIQKLPPDLPAPAMASVRRRVTVAKLAAESSGLNADQPWRRQIPKAGPAPAVVLPVGSSFTLANGLTVIHHYNPALPLVSAEVVLRSGANANPPGHPGLASFTAAMLQEGTTTRSAPRIAADIAQLGATLSTSSGPDSSQASVFSLKAGFDKALEVLADVVQHPAFPPLDVERQQASRLGELHQQREDAAAVADVAAAAALYGTAHPWGYGSLGTEKAILGTDRAALHGFWRAHYVPNNAALVVAGDITQAELTALAEARFGAWTALPAEAGSAPNPATTAARLVMVDKPAAPQTALRITSIGPARSTADFAPLQVMNAALGGLFTSRINNSLREEKGYSYGVYSRFDYRRAPGPFAVAGSVRTDVTGPAVAEIFKEIKGMRERPMGPAELANARNAQVLSLPSQFDTNQNVGESLANLFLHKLPTDYYRTLPQQFASVTAAQAQAAARTWLTPDKLIVVAVGDRKAIAPQLARLRLGEAEVRDADGKLP